MTTFAKSVLPSQKQPESPCASNCRQTGTSASGSHPILRMQRAAGNHSVGPLLQRSAATHSGPSLRIGAPDTPEEREADRVAAAVMRMPDGAIPRLIGPGSPTLHRKCAACNDEQEKLHRSATGESVGTAPPIVNEVLSRPGQPLPDSTRDFFESRLGADLSAVRVHTDNQAAHSADAVQAKAYTVGNSIAFATGHYAPQSDSGKCLLAHELVHVVQQDGNSGQQLMRFAQGTTKIKDGRYQEGTGHAGMTEEALQGMGLDPMAARRGRLGNWERDMSQALTPGTVALLSAERIMPILQILAIKEFGRGLSLSEFGTYDPVEHIDNPTDLRGSDVFDQLGSATGADALASPNNPDVGITSRLEGTAGSEKSGYAALDTRYTATPTRGRISNPEDATAFQIDQTAIPRYMNTSKLWLTNKLRRAAVLGRTNQGGLGPREFSSGIHTMQDFYAHSNFCEISINILIKNRELPGTLINILLPANSRLDTQIHANDDAGNPVAANLTIVDLKGEDREVLTTGSFNLSDTAASILEELADKVKEMNPFDAKTKGPSELTMACLDYLEMDSDIPTDFTRLGRAIAGHIREASGVMATLAQEVTRATMVAGNAGASVVWASSSVASSALDVLNSVNAKLGGDSHYFDETKALVTETGEGVASDIISGANGLSTAVRHVDLLLTAAAEAAAVQIESESHMLRRLYEYTYQHTPLKLIKHLARKIPIIGERVAATIEMAEEKIRTLLEDTLGAAWNGAITRAVATIVKIVAKIREETNIQKKRRQLGTGMPGKLGGVADLYDEKGHPVAGIAPKFFTPPSHTQIAKDHDDILTPVRDGVIDVDEQRGHGEDEHGDNHISSFLAPLATGLAKMASNGIGEKVALCWDEVDRGEIPTAEQLAAVNAAISHYFAHPADSNYWQAFFKEELKTFRIGIPVTFRAIPRRDLD